MKKSTATYILIGVFTLGLITTSCRTSKNLKKCDGRKTTKTRMGNM